MARNGSGVYNLPPANYPAVSSTLITAANRNAIDADLATALTNSIAVNGESVITANIPMGGNKLTGLAAGTTAGDSVRFEQLSSLSATSIINTPAGNIAAITVQSAINELDTKKLALAGGSLTGLLNVNDGADIASATTVDLTVATGNTVRITGTTTITAFTMNAGQQMEIVAVGALPLTYHATTMNINGGVSYTCTANDRLSVFKDGSGVIQVNVTKQDGTPIVGVVTYASQADYNTGTDTTKALNSAILRGNNLVAGTAINTTSGTSHDFTGIPSWAKRITLMLSDVGTNGSSILQVQIGDSGGVENTGYAGQAWTNTTSGVATTGLYLHNANAAANTTTGQVVFNKINGNTWVASGIMNVTNASNLGYQCITTKTLSDTLDRIRLTTVNGTDTFDAGVINIIYE